MHPVRTLRNILEILLSPAKRHLHFMFSQVILAAYADLAVFIQKARELRVVSRLVTVWLKGKEEAGNTVVCIAEPEG